MHYLDEGSREHPVVLLLHGNPTWSYMYRNLIIELSKTHRCIVPDHMGCGLSDKPNLKGFSYDLKGHSQNIFDLLEHLSIQRFSLVVHDWGGAIGFTAFRNELDRLKEFVLLNTAAFTSRDVPKRILLCRLPLLGGFLVRGLNGFAWPATYMATTKGLSERTKSELLFPYNNWKNRIAVWRFVKDIPYEKNHPTYSLLLETESKLVELRNTRSLACWGMKDFCFHPGFLSQWKNMLPNLHSKEYSDAGHYLLEDANIDCNEKISGFFRA